MYRQLFPVRAQLGACLGGPRPPAGSFKHLGIVTFRLRDRVETTRPFVPGGDVQRSAPLPNRLSRHTPLTGDSAYGVDPAGADQVVAVDQGRPAGLAAGGPGVRAVADAVHLDLSASIFASQPFTHAALRGPVRAVTPL